MFLEMLHSFLTLTTYWPVASKGLSAVDVYQVAQYSVHLCLGYIIGETEKLYVLPNWMIWRRIGNAIYFCINASIFLFIFVTTLYYYLFLEVGNSLFS